MPEATHGLKFRVSSDELRQHLKKRAEYHRDRAKSKGEILPNLRETTKQLSSHKPANNIGAFPKNTSSNYRFDGEGAVEELESDIESHLNKSAYFDWLSDHLFPGEYSLMESDLVSLEIVKRSW